ncbi:MAG: hypothetical protein ACP5QG_06425 [candidate division WOR-3 bacterium]
MPWREDFLGREKVWKQEVFEVKVVLDDDVEELLKNMGLLDGLKAGRLTCALCGNLVSLDNFGGVFRKNGVIKVFCSEPLCFNRAIEEAHK